MNEIWGSENATIVWHLPIAIYLFLAGLSCGAMITALIMEWRHKATTAFVKAGLVIAPVAIIIGLVVLIFDLSKPWNFYQLLIHYNLASVMSLGVILLLCYTPLCVVYGILRFRRRLERGILGAIMRNLSGILDVLEAHSLLFGRVIFVLSIGVGVYTGFLLSAIETYPLFNSPLLPILFLVSGLSSGIAACVCGGILLFDEGTCKHGVGELLKMDLWFIPTEILLLFAFFIGVYFQGADKASVAASSLTQGLWAGVFWIGVVGFGVIAPSIIALTALKNHAYKVNFILINAVFVMLGVLSLRLFILYAGQIFI